MGIVAGGTYLPLHRLDRSRIGAALGTPGGAGTRTVAAADEDTTTLGVEAARNALAGLASDAMPERVLFATAEPAYLDKTNATTIHAALGLPVSVPAYDVGGAVRSAMGALRLADDATEPTLVVLAGLRTGLPGGADERDGGDGAVAFVVSVDTDAAQTRTLGWGAASVEFLERWRLPGETHSHQWEERFGEHAYVPLACDALANALNAAGTSADDLDHVVVTGVHPRAARTVARAIKVAPDKIADDLAASVGNTGAAHAGLLLAGVLEHATPRQKIAVLSIADGADAVVLETTEQLGRVVPRHTLVDQIGEGKPLDSYETFLTWRGFLEREPPRRPDPVAPAAPPSLRSEDWKFGFTGSACEACGEVHLPPARVCANCGAVDRMTPVRAADRAATIVTFTVDRLAYTPSPPLVAAVLDFDGGGRFQCALTDVDAGTVKIGDRVEMTFRRVDTAQKVHNYFWKARPLR
ncbi:MAG: OB-fold domain-containing protein [Acidimicrobiia bacterium]